MKKLTLNAIFKTLAEDDTIQWTVEDDSIRGKIKNKGPCFCPISAYVVLRYGLVILEEDAVDFATKYLNMEADDALTMITVSDDAYFGDIIEDPIHEMDFEKNFEIKRFEKARKQLLKATVGD